MNMFKNLNCDNDKCISPNAEVRKLPSGRDGNMILCHECYLNEIKYREEMNAKYGENRFYLPSWESLEIYI